MIYHGLESSRGEEGNRCSTIDYALKIVRGSTQENVPARCTFSHLISICKRLQFEGSLWLVSEGAPCRTLHSLFWFQLPSSTTSWKSWWSLSNTGRKFHAKVTRWFHLLGPLFPLGCFPTMQCSSAAFTFSQVLLYSVCSRAVSSRHPKWRLSKLAK